MRTEAQEWFVRRLRNSKGKRRTLKSRQWAGGSKATHLNQVGNTLLQFSRRSAKDAPPPQKTEKVSESKSGKVHRHKSLCAPRVSRCLPSVPISRSGTRRHNTQTDTHANTHTHTNRHTRKHIHARKHTHTQTNTNTHKNSTLCSGGRHRRLQTSAEEKCWSA